MELLETQDPEKRKLLETSNRHRQEMEREIKDISQKTEKVLKNALIIGGALALTYIVVNQLSSSKTKKKKKPKSFFTITFFCGVLDRKKYLFTNALYVLLL